MGVVLICLIQTEALIFIHLPFNSLFVSLLCYLSLFLSLTLIHTHSVQAMPDWIWIKHVHQKREKQLAFTYSLTIRVYTTHGHNRPPPPPNRLTYKHIYTIFPQRFPSHWQMDLLNQFKKTDCFYCEPLPCFYRPFKLPNSPIVVLCLLSTLEPYQCVLSR